MPCINCYIAWARDLLPSLFPLLIGLFYFLRPSSSPNHSSSLATPTYGPRYLPPFLRGLIAAYEIGRDEDAFLKALRGIGRVVWIPWPIGQYFVTDEEVMKEVYETDKKVLAFVRILPLLLPPLPRLSSPPPPPPIRRHHTLTPPQNKTQVPIRQSIQHTTFGSSLSVSYSPEMSSQLFPLHSKSLSKNALELPYARFLKTLRGSLDALKEEVESSEEGEVEVDLIDWVTETMFDASLVALYGPSLLASTTNTTSSSSSKGTTNRLHNLFKTFDTSFPLFASEIIPPSLQPLVKPMRDGTKARKEMVEIFREWIEEGAEGCEDGVIWEMINLGKRVGWSKEEVANVLVADCWALQANAPFCAVWLLLYILQSPPSTSLLSSLLTEYSSLPSLLSLNSYLPLTQSCITETLRTATSSFSIRVAQRDCELGVVVGGGEKGGMGYRVRKGEKVVCSTRCAHLDEGRWEEAEEWDGRRFFDGEDLAGEKSGGGDGEKRYRARGIHGFGGGISICEGRHLATSELKAFLALTLSSFDIILVPSTTSNSSENSSLPSLAIKGAKDAVRPKILPGRVGLGLVQFEDSGIKLRFKRRVGGGSEHL